VSSVVASSVQVGDRLAPLVVPITARTVVLGASASRDWQPQHHDHHWAVERAGTRDIFLNTPNQAGWIERYLTDWTGPKGRLGRLQFRMRRPVCPGDDLRFDATVRAVSPDGWIDLDVWLRVDDTTVTECTARVAVPTDGGDNPWGRRGAEWRP
jgi:acyl dehydratase